ncbi:FAD/NAD(P)-binding protein [Pseudarthrobacter sp. O4]|uniref:FAD/NAD(P)-binding protein n=1 Tax=Pseudarthrobacter sp. O4 TaxID=3418417 RepID=UPI003CFACA5A
MGISQSIRTALIGAGPRGTSVLERLLANWVPAGPDARLHIDVVDPYPAGPGHVWQPGQSRLYLMNTQSFYPTIVPEDPALAPPLAGDTFDRWRELQQRRPHPSLTAEERAELAALGSADFPSRALYGRYLRSTLEELLSVLPAGVTVEFHETTAVSVRHAAAPAAGPDAVASPDAGTGSHAGTGHDGDLNGRVRFDVGLAGGAVLTVDSVVLALGHLESRLNPEQRELKAAAEELGLLYLPPAAPADVDWSRVPAVRPVLVRGMGLNFFDVMGQLTEGRGGTFLAGEDGGLSYRPSGREPLIIAASRRGTPYRAKAALAGYYPSAVTLRYCTESALARFGEAGIQPAFDHDLWPLLHRDAVWAYYSTLARSQPGAILTDPTEFLRALEESLRPHAHSAAKWEDAVDSAIAVHVRPAHRLDLLGLAAPLAGRSFDSRAELDAAVVEYLLDDARRSALGEDDPVKMTIGALHHGRAVLKTAVADGGITDESWVAGLRGWFESFVEGLASGPPALRAEQLAALARAGVVRFVGPDPKFGVDRKAGTFTAASPWVGGRGAGSGGRGAGGTGTRGTGAGGAQGEAVAAGALIEALAPANRVAVNVSALLEQLLAEGLVRPRLMMTVEGVPVQTSGLDVSPHPYRPLGSNGTVTEGLYVLGLQLSAAQWGTAIAAEARQKNGPAYRSGQRTLHDADEIARGILGILTRNKE